jgi:hypothetical protein
MKMYRTSYIDQGTCRHQKCGSVVRKAVLPIEFTSAFGGNAGLATEAWQRQRHIVIKSAGPCGTGLCDDMGFYRY